MRIALIDVDGHNFTNLPLMKLSAWHKQRGDTVEWYNPLTAWIDPPDRVYMSKVFTFTPDYLHPVNALEIIKGGTGYAYPSGGKTLPDEIINHNKPFDKIKVNCPREVFFSSLDECQEFCHYLNRKNGELEYKYNKSGTLFTKASGK